MNIDPRKLRHTFSKHAAGFGISGTWNSANAALLGQAIRGHAASSMVQQIPGTYRGTVAVTHYREPATDLRVTVAMSGNFVAGWKLSSTQRACLLSS